MLMQDREDDPSRPANNTPYTLYLTPYTLYLTPYATEVTDRRIVRVPGQRTPHYIVIDLDSGFWVLGFLIFGFWVLGSWFLGFLGS